MDLTFMQSYKPLPALVPGKTYRCVADKVEEIPTGLKIFWRVPGHAGLALSTHYIKGESAVALELGMQTMSQLIQRAGKPVAKSEELTGMETDMRMVSQPDNGMLRAELGFSSANPF